MSACSGSAARRTDGPESDVDLVVSRPPGVGLLTMAAFAVDASELFGVEVDVVTDGGLGSDHPILGVAEPV